MVDVGQGCERVPLPPARGALSIYQSYIHLFIYLSNFLSIQRQSTGSCEAVSWAGVGGI